MLGVAKCRFELRTLRGREVDNKGVEKGVNRVQEVPLGHTAEEGRVQAALGKESSVYGTGATRGYQMRR